MIQVSKPMNLNCSNKVAALPLNRHWHSGACKSWSHRHCQAAGAGSHEVLQVDFSPHASPIAYACMHGLPMPASIHRTPGGINTMAPASKYQGTRADCHLSYYATWYLEAVPLSTSEYSRNGYACMHHSPLAILDESSTVAFMLDISDSFQLPD